MSLSINSDFNGVTDPDAGRYIAAVEAADGQLLEFAVGKAMNNFIVGCKADGTWDAIKASCILSGARTLAGALVPLAGTAPTNNGPFVSGDYNRKTGLVGDGSTKYLDSNRANNADPLNSSSLAVYATTLATSTSFYIGIGNAFPYANAFGFDGNIFTYSRSSAFGRPDPLAGSHATGLIGIDRSSSSNYRTRSNQITSTATISSNTVTSTSLRVYASADVSGLISNARLAFYSIGESLDLALLDARVTALITAFGVAIP
jgi:hypothetical protein